MARFADARPTTLQPEVARARRPKWLTLMLLGLLAEDGSVAVSTGTFIEVLSRLGVSSHAARSTLTRMVDNGHMHRHRHGRETYYALTAHGTLTLREGNARAWQHVDPEWDGTWTVLAYSIPEEMRALRLRLRSRLAWGRFGMLRSGMWIAPGHVDVASLLDDLDVMEHVRVFFGTPAARTVNTELIEEAYDLEEIAERYRRFVARWSDDPLASFPDEMCALLVLRSEWQQLVQADPRLPSDHLPSGWPAAEAVELFRARYQRLEGLATQIAEKIAVVVSTERAS